MEVIAKDLAARLFTPDERCAGKCNLDGVLVGIEKVRKETSARLVTAMRFVHNEHALQIRGVIRDFHFLSIVFKFLDVHHGNFIDTGVALQGLLRAELLHEFRAGICRCHLETAIAQFFGRLLQQIQTVHNKVEFRDFVLLGVIVLEDFAQVERKRRLARALRMPHNAGCRTRCQFFTDNHGRKKLLVTHDVLFVSALDLTVLLFFDMQVSDAILEQKEQTLRAHHRSKHAVRGRVDV